jgi:hypothetical protein
VVPLGERQSYMAAREKASVGDDIGPMRNFWQDCSENASLETRYRRCQRRNLHHILPKLPFLAMM